MTPRTLPISRRQQSVLDRMQEGWTLTADGAGDYKLVRDRHGLKVRPETVAALLQMERIVWTPMSGFRLRGPDRWRLAQRRKESA